MDDAEKRAQSLMRLPSLINWVRHNRRRLDDTIFQLREFAYNPPRHSLRQVHKLCADIAYGTIGESAALTKLESFGQPAARVSAREVVPAFCKYLRDTGIKGVIELNDFRTMYIIGKKPNDDPLFVPVKPTFIGLKDEKLIPIFLVAWVDFELDDFQKFLLSTIICDSILTYEDFIGSDAEIVAFPRIKGTKSRYQRGWNARQYDLLSQQDLIEQFERYSRALRTVVMEIRGH